MMATFWGKDSAVAKLHSQIRVSIFGLSTTFFLEDFMLASSFFPGLKSDLPEAHLSSRCKSRSSIFTRSVSSFNSSRTCGRRLM